MRGYRAFLSKEVKENSRNYKFMIILIVFSIVGLLSPLSAKFLPVLLESLVDDTITIIIQDPTYVDSWVQFFSNTNQISLIVFLLLFSPLMSKEFEKGTFVHMVTKGLPRQTIILSKATVLLISWTVGYWLSALITFVYTHLYFSDSRVEGLLLPLVSLYSFGILLLAVLLVSAVIFKSAFAPLLAVGGFVVFSFIGDIFPAVHKWNPLQLATRNLELLVNQEGDQLLAQAFGVTGILTIGCLVGSIYLFKRRNIN